MQLNFKEKRQFKFPNKRLWAISSVIIAILLLPQMPYAYNRCTDLFASIIEVVDAEYSRLLETRNDTLVGRQKIALGVHDLLKRALYPLAERLNFLGINVKLNQIDLSLKKNEAEYPIKSANFVGYQGGFHADIKSNSHHAELVENLVKSNSVGGNFKGYRYDLQEEIGHRGDKKAFWIEPSEERIKEYGLFHALLSTIITPDGAYGEKFSRDLLRTTQIMMDLAAKDPRLRQLSLQTYNSNLHLLSSEAQRVKQQNNENAIPELTPLSGALEGILSFHQLVSAVLAEKITGINTGAEALEAIVNRGANKKLGLTAELVSRLTMGVVAPMTMGGFYFKSPFVRNELNELELSPGIKNLLARFSKKIIDLGLRKGRCPMAGLFSRKSADVAASNNSLAFLQNKEKAESEEKAGLQLLAEAYLEVFKKVQAAEIK